MKIEYEVGDHVSRKDFYESCILSVTEITPEGLMVQAKNNDSRHQDYPKEPFLIPWDEVTVHSNYVRNQATVMNIQPNSETPAL